MCVITLIRAHTLSHTHSHKHVQTHAQVQFACLSLTASIAALGKGIELSVTEAEDTLVSAAVENSDRCDVCVCVHAYMCTCDL